MGLLTANQIISQGMALAGRDGISTQMFSALDNWLRSQAASWAWPYTQARASGLALSAGSTSLNVGGTGDITNLILRIYDPIYVYSSDRSTRMVARIRELLDGPLGMDENAINTSSARGVPSSFKVRSQALAFGRWTLIPYPVPDRDLLLAFDYQIQPPTLASTSTIPPYPNDRTMVQAVKAFACDYAKRPEAQRELDVLASMVVDDRDKFGQVPGTNDMEALDGGVFRSGNRGTTYDPYGWNW